MAAKGDGEGDDAAGPGGGRRLTWIKIGAAVLLMQALTIGLVAALTWVIVQHHKVLVVGDNQTTVGNAGE